MLEDGGGRVERAGRHALRVHQVLGVVAHDHAVARLDGAGVGRERPGRQLEQGGLAGAVGADDPDPLAPLHRRVEAAVDHPGAEGLGDPLEAQHLLAGAGRLGEAEADGGAVLQDLHLLHLVEQLLLRLGLGRLGGLGAEALDEPLELVALVLLLLGGRLQPGLLLDAPLPVGGHAAGVAPHPLRLQGQHPGDLPVEEVAVVADQQHGPPQPAQEGVEPGQGGDVEVVGRLVEQQEVRVLQQQAGQRGPHLPAAREGRGGLQEVPLLEAEPAQQPLGPVAPEPLLEVVELLVEVGQGRRELELLLRVRSPPPGRPRRPASRSSSEERPGTAASTDSSTVPLGRAATSCGR